MLKKNIVSGFFVSVFMCAASAASPAGDAFALKVLPGGCKAMFEPGQVPEVALVGRNGSSDETTMHLDMETFDYFGKTVDRRKEELRVPARGESGKTVYFGALSRAGFYCTRVRWTAGGCNGIEEGSFVKVGPLPEKADKLFGISGYSSEDAQMREVYRLMGAGTKGVHFEWRSFPEKDGKYDFSSKKANVRALVAQGMAVRGLISFVCSDQAPDRYFKPEFLPRFRQMDRKGDPIADQDAYYADMEKYILQLVGEFKGEIRSWSLYGEINLLLRWAPHIRQRYLDTVRIAAKAIRKADPTAIIYGLGVSGGDGRGAVRYPVIRQLIPELKGLLDGFGIDQYTAGKKYGKGHVTMNSEESELREIMLAARKIADENGIRYISIDEKGPAFDTALPISTPLGAEAGDMVAREYIILKSLPFVETWLYFRPTNWKVTRGGSDFGMWQDVNPRQTLSAYAGTARQLAGAGFVREIRVHKDMRCYVFNRAGRDFAAMWYNGSDPLLIRSPEVGSLTVTDLQGNPVEVENATLRVFRSPIYVSGMSAGKLEKVLLSADLNVPYIAAAFDVQATGRSVLAVRNLTGKALTAAVAEFTAEPPFDWTSGDIRLAPNETRRIEVPCSPAKTKIVLRSSIGGPITVTDEYRPHVLKRVTCWEDVARLEPVRLDDPERQIPSYLDLKANGVCTGTEDLSAEARFGYDDKHFYVDCRVTDDVHLNDALGAWLLWMGDSVQFFFDARRDGVFGRLEGCKGEMPDDSLVSIGDIKGWKCGYLHYGLNVDGKRTPSRHLPVKPEITRDEVKKTTRYRLKLPFSCISPLKPEKGRAFGFSFIVFDKDHSKQHYAYGISPTPASVAWNDPFHMPVFVFE